MEPAFPRTRTDQLPSSDDSDALDFRENELGQVWILSLVLSVAIVAGLFWYANYTHGHDWIPLGYDSYYYVGFIKQVVSSGPLQFAASQHYVEFLYPIVVSVPVFLGASPDLVEIVLPVILACATVVATGILALESRDWRIATLTVAFTSGWFTLYRMGADFHANLFAFPLLILATVLLLRAARKERTSGSVLGVFLLLVIVAAATHVETTDFFIASWFVAFTLLGRPFASWKRTSLMVITAGMAAAPFTVAYFQNATGGPGGQYCVFPPYWLEVFGPAAGLAVLGIGVAAWHWKAPASVGYFARLLLSWSVLAVAIGVLGYVAQFPITISDRSLLLLPLPLVSSLGTLWLAERAPRPQRFSQATLLTIAAIAIPLVLAPLVFVYAAPHFAYFAEHGPTFVTCAKG